MKARTLVVLMAMVVVIGCGGSDGGAPPPTKEIQGWDVRRATCAAGTDIFTCYDKGERIPDVNRLAGQETYIWMFLVDNPSGNIISGTVSVSFGGEVVYRETAEITFPAGQPPGDAEVLWGIIIGDVTCGSYEMNVYISYADGSSTPTYAIPFGITSKCMKPGPARSMTVPMAGGWAILSDGAGGR